jgi:hypothetical protein
MGQVSAAVPPAVARLRVEPYRLGRAATGEGARRLSAASRLGRLARDGTVLARPLYDG